MYDAKAKRKISSDFHAQLNNDVVRDMANPVGIQDKTGEMHGEPERKKINYSWIEKPKQEIFDIFFVKYYVNDFCTASFISF